MNSKDLSLGYLFDFYGELLSDRQREIFDFYYNDDLSLSEIADQIGITRQGVRDLLKKAESELINYESKLGLAKRFKEVSESAEKIIAKLGRLRDTYISGQNTECNTAFDELIREIGELRSI